MIKIDNISVDYNGEIVLENVSFNLPDGEIAVLLGANGAGKTTLVRALNAAVAIRAGAIEIDRTPIRQMSRRQIARRMAVVAQENETRFPITVFEFVLSGRFSFGGNFGWESDKDLSAVSEALEACELSEYAHRNMNHLSGGERQRVVLARALATGAPTLLLDEPTANLDLSHQSMMFRLVRDRCRNRGASAVVITHDLNLASEFADKVIMLSLGRLVALGTPADVLTVDNIGRVFGVDVLLDRSPVSGNVRVTTVY